MKCVLQILLISCLVVSCKADKQRPLDVEAMTREIRAHLFGGQNPTDYLRCKQDVQCTSGVCSFDHCSGMLMAHQRWVQRDIASRLLKRVASKPRLDVLTAVLKNILTSSATDTMVKVRTLEFLKRLPTTIALPLIRPFQLSKVRAIRRAAAFSSVFHGDSKNLAELITLLKSKNLQLQFEAVKALGRIGKPVALVALARLLDHDSHLIQLRTVEAIGRIGTRAALKLLVGLLESEDNDFLKYHSALHLRRITKQPFGIQAKAWRRWLAQNHKK